MKKNHSGFDRIHPVRRLRSRYGIEIRPDQFRALERFVGSPVARANPDLMRRIRHVSPRDGQSGWRVNLWPLFGESIWVGVVYSDRDGRIVTILPRSCL